MSAYEREMEYQEFGTCPRCQIPLQRFVDSHYGADTDGNRGIEVDWVECPQCEWQEGDEKHVCDMCGVWSEERYETSQGNFCETCAIESGEYRKCTSCDDLHHIDEMPHGQVGVCQACTEMGETA